MPETRFERVLFLIGLTAIAALMAMLVPAWLNYRATVASQSTVPSAFPDETGREIAAANRVPAHQTASTATSLSITPPREEQPAKLALTAARGDCWLEVHAGSATGRSLYEGVLAEGKSLSYSAPRLWIRLGAAENVDAILDGRPVANFPRGTADIVATSRGVRPAPA